MNLREILWKSKRFYGGLCTNNNTKAYKEKGLPEFARYNSEPIRLWRRR